MPLAIAAVLLLQSGSADSSALRHTNGLVPPAVTALRVDRPPSLDGRLDDPAWTLAPASTGLLQTDPDEGKAVSESTEVRIIYDADALYVGVRLFDAQPLSIVSRLGRRDANTHSDEFRLLLDSYHDHRTAFEFIVNPAGVKKDVLRRGDGNTYYGGAGLDLKYGVSSNFTLDATINPDFGQVELDPAYVNLTAFEQFLDEHRPFFVEGTQIFDFGGNGGGVNKFKSTPLFYYSRRIGREPQGEPTSSGDFKDVPTSTTILGAAKLSGRTADGWSVGVLDALTARERATVVDMTSGARYHHEVEPPTNYFVGRVKRDFAGGNTNIGFLTTAVHRRLDTPALEFLPTTAYASGLVFFTTMSNITHNYTNIEGHCYSC